MGRKEGISLEELRQMKGYKPEENNSANYTIVYSDKHVNGKKLAGNKTNKVDNKVKQPSNKANKTSNNAKLDIKTYDATAPYNFVSLPVKAVPAPLNSVLAKAADQADVRAAYREYITTQGRNTGYIDVEITTATPCFIGGNGSEFFAPTGEPMIPGSTLRGMVKNIFKMITCGAMRGGEDLTDKHLYSRGLAAKGSFGKYYTKRMSVDKEIIKDGNKETISVSRAEGGFLIKVKGEYFICPAKGKAVRYQSQYDIPRGAKIIWHDDGSTDCHTGSMMSKKHYYHIANADWSPENRLTVSAQAVSDYRDDKTRKGLDLFAKALKGNEAAGFTHDKDVEMVVPCYYVAENGEVQHFGHGRYYRIPYKKSIAEHISTKVQAADIVDFADAVFGCKELWSSRVSFGNAQICGDAHRLDKSRTHPLMTPNPTSFQLYLKQNDDNKLLHWDDMAKLRGYKLYWHQKNDENKWKIDKNEDVKGMTEIRPLAKGNRFVGRIRFRDLSDVELGALLEVFALSRQSNTFFKLGMGKPIGMGSVKLDSKVWLIDEQVAYGSLLDGDDWQRGEQTADEAYYLQTFRSYMAEQFTDAKLQKQYEKLMQELNTMLSWDNTKKSGWSDKIKYMPLGDKYNRDYRFRDRAILPSPQEVVKS